MAQQMVNIGAAANDGTGDPIRSGGQKINANFSELYAFNAGFSAVGLALRGATDSAAARGAIGAGTVTSVSGSGGSTGLTLTGGAITGSGTLTLGGTLGIANGGTGATTASAARTNLGLGGGVSGTFANPTSITVVNGIVTAIS